MAEALGHPSQLENLLELVRAGDAPARERLIEHACRQLRLLTLGICPCTLRRRWQQARIRLYQARQEERLPE